MVVVGASSVASNARAVSIAVCRSHPRTDVSVVNWHVGLESENIHMDIISFFHPTKQSVDKFNYFVGSLNQQTDSYSQGYSKTRRHQEDKET